MVRVFEEAETNFAERNHRSYPWAPSSSLIIFKVFAQISLVSILKIYPQACVDRISSIFLLFFKDMNRNPTVINNLFTLLTILSMRRTGERPFSCPSLKRQGGDETVGIITEEDFFAREIFITI